MSSLPHEVLALTFSHLNKEDILQCQVTSKQWRESSTQYLYSNIDMEMESTARLYIRTISESPRLGKYLKNIDFKNLFEVHEEKIVADEFGLLDTVALHCPNVLQMDSSEYDSSIWTHIMHAASQGQLSCLRALPKSDTAHLKSYIFTALMFKNSLSSLVLCDYEYFFGPQLNRLDAYQTLCDQLNQFKNLRRIEMYFCSDRYLSYFDELIDECLYLEEFILGISILGKQYLSEQISSITPRPDIHTFRSNWKVIGSDGQLIYLMHKFPKLRTFSIGIDDLLWGHSSPTLCSQSILVKFIHYAVSIPDYRLRLDIKEKDLINLWDTFWGVINTSKIVTVAYSQHLVSSYRLQLFSEEGFNVIFSPTMSRSEIPHLKLFRRIGRSIRSLRINDMSQIFNGEYLGDSSIDSIFDILVLCPLIEDLALSRPPEAVTHSNNESRYPSVKKLSIFDVRGNSSLAFLGYLSLNLPNLKQLVTSFHYDSADKSRHVSIDMPHTSLDLLKWTDESYTLESRKGAEVYIRCNTEKGLKFYVGVKNFLYPVEIGRYNSSIENIRFDITCRHLKELQIIRKYTPEFNCNLVF